MCSRSHCKSAVKSGDWRRSSSRCGSHPDRHRLMPVEGAEAAAGGERLRRAQDSPAVAAPEATASRSRRTSTARMFRAKYPARVVALILA